MHTISINNLNTARNQLIERNMLDIVSKEYRKGKAKPEQAILITKPSKDEIARIIVEGQIYTIRYDYKGGQYCLMFGKVEFRSPSGNGRVHEEKVLGSCTEIILHQDKFLFTKYGSHEESCELGLSTDAVQDVASYLGFTKCSKNIFRFYNNDFKQSELGKMVLEWSDKSPNLAKKLNNGDYTKDLLAA
jgi:hypothetical protein